MGDCFSNMTGSSGGLNFNCGAVAGAIGGTQIAYFAVGGVRRRRMQTQSRIGCGNLSAIWHRDPVPARASPLFLPSVRLSDDDSNCAAHANGSLAVLRVDGEKPGHQIGLTVIQFTKQGMNR